MLIKKFDGIFLLLINLCIVKFFYKLLKLFCLVIFGVRLKILVKVFIVVLLRFLVEINLIFCGCLFIGILLWNVCLIFEIDIFFMFGDVVLV